MTDGAETSKYTFRKQTHCFTCGNRIGQTKRICPTCGELQCSDACLDKHVKTMDWLPANASHR